MREILFRGKRCDNGEWVFGSLWLDDVEIENCETASISWWSDDKTVWNRENVTLATVGQFTCLTDKNGKKIFEGDILDCKSGLYDRCKVIYNEFCSAFQLECADGFSDFFLCSINHKEMEIIGNIYDNPELL